ncbi:hypothetical protein [Maridesulfovibrio sp.]|uniref:hypothetical protein n=1 Tax=Maridesulfovibrio sp. TaxID=2795000 RepID=UPI002AA86C53|nr:hypothetical protein [Maridesulfovibrio sp.]
MAKKQNENVEVKAKKGFTESRYNPTLLRQMCENNVDAATAKQKLGLSSLQSLRQHLMRLSVTDNQLRTLPELYSRSSSTIRIGKYGLKLSAKKLESLGDFPVGSEFTVEVEDGKIILEMISAGGAEDPADDAVTDHKGESGTEAPEEASEA